MLVDISVFLRAENAHPNPLQSHPHPKVSITTTMNGDSRPARLAEANRQLNRSIPSFVALHDDDRTPTISTNNIDRSSRPASHHSSPLASHDPTFVSSIWATIKHSYLNILLIFVPLGLLSGKLEWNESSVFILNFIAIVPLAKLLGFATEEIALKTNQTIGGLLNATFGNAIEMIISLMALKEEMYRVIQVSLLGSILSNALLVLGFCFLLGGLKYPEQSFNVYAANTSASMLCLTVFGLMLPAAFKTALKNEDEDLVLRQVLELSRGTSIVLLLAYLFYLVFQLKTHRKFYEDDERSRDVERAPLLSSRANPYTRQFDDEEVNIDGDTNDNAGEEDDDDEEPQLTTAFAIGLLFFVTLMVCFCSEYLVDSIGGISESWGLSASFIGLILLPIVGNAAEHVSAVTFSLKNKTSLAISIAVGSSMQIALFVTPALVLISWMMGKELSLQFELFEVVIVFASVFLLNSLLADGKGNWLEGVLLLCCYFIISLAYFIIP